MKNVQGFVFPNGACFWALIEIWPDQTGLLTRNQWSTRHFFMISGQWPTSLKEISMMWATGQNDTSLASLNIVLSSVTLRLTIIKYGSALMRSYHQDLWTDYLINVAYESTTTGFMNLILYRYFLIRPQSITTWISFYVVQHGNMVNHYR